tara:strand:- start:686 stop:934 length:249 start_codon:yes stop_codon:yes gene_type:complete
VDKPFMKRPAARALCSIAWMTTLWITHAPASSADAAIKSWIESPGHCHNLMNDAFTDMGMAHAEDSDSRFTHYWVQTLGAPR